MKRILLLYFLIMTVWPISAQNLIVYQLDGDVRLRRAGTSEWTSIARKDSLDPNDHLSIPSKGYIRILDTRDDAIYRIGPTKATSTRNLIVAAKKQAESVTARLNEELIADLKDQQTQPEYTVIGGSNRGETVSDSLVWELASALLGHSDGNAPLYYEKILEDDGGFHFRLHNYSDVSLFVNVLRRNAGGINLCFETSIPNNSCILIPQGQTFELTSYCFRAGDAQFTVFGTTLPVDSRVLLRYLKKAEKASSIPEGAMIGSRK